MFLSNPSLIELPAQAVMPTALPDRVYAVLKRRLLTCVIRPGERIVEKDLCNSLKVSRTPVREALNRLANEGLIVFQPHAGYRAAPLTADGFQKLNEVRLAVESQVAALAAQRATPADIAAMRAAATVPEIKPGDDDSFDVYCRANARFHLLVVRSTGNTLFEGIVMAALDHFQKPAYLGIGRQSDASNPSQRHMEIVDAIEAKDETLARERMSQHVIGGTSRIIEALRAAGY